MKLTIDNRKQFFTAFLFALVCSVAVTRLAAQPAPLPDPAIAVEEAGPENAAGTEPATESKGAPESLFTVIIKGGATMIALAIVSSIIAALGLERYFYFRKQKLNVKNFYKEIQSVLREGGLAAAEKFLKTRDSLIARVLAAGIEQSEQGRTDVGQEIVGEANVAIGRLERGLSLFANLGNLAPLLGFFGTVVGMRVSFLQFVEKAAPTAQDLAGGVEEALITTAAGLLIAIPTHLVYNLFLYRVDDFTLEVERSAAAIARTTRTQASVMHNGRAEAQPTGAAGGGVA